MEEIRLEPGVADEAVRSELERILASPEFRSSRRCQDFLRFVVERTLAGQPEVLKERTIGIEVFGRPTAYDTSADGIVRINASEVRKRLAVYYALPARHTDVRITLPVGSYVPQFCSDGKSTGETSLRPPDPAPVSFPSAWGVRSRPIAGATQKPKSRRKAALWAVALVLVAAIVSIRWLDLRRSANVVDQFWNPLFQGSTPILIVPAYVPTYDPATNPPNGSFTLMTDQYVGGGDLLAVVEVSSMLMHKDRTYNVRMGTDVSLDDLRNTPTVLIGYSSTQWEGVTNKFRFFVDDSSHGMIRDNGKPTDWYPHHETAEHHTDEDYAVISRAFDPETHAMLILVSGCMQYGTEGAARMITNPDQLAAALHGAPKDWQQKNLQLVIQLDVVANSPASSKVVASYYW
jgi:hypothetical protein